MEYAIARLLASLDAISFLRLPPLTELQLNCLDNTMRPEKPTWKGIYRSRMRATATTKDSYLGSDTLKTLIARSKRQWFRREKSGADK